MRSVFLKAAVCIVTAGFLPACKLKDKAPEPPPSAAVKAYEFDDVPVPRDFALLRDQSCVIQNHTFRSGKLLYRGRLQMDLLRDWYKKAMTAVPAPAWKLAPAPQGESGAGPYTLRFDKGIERCEVFIEAPMNETFVTVTLGLK